MDARDLVVDASLRERVEPGLVEHLREADQHRHEAPEPRPAVVAVEEHRQPAGRPESALDEVERAGQRQLAGVASEERFLRALAIREAEIYTEEKRQAERVNALAEASRAVVSILDINDLLDEVVDADDSARQQWLQALPAETEVPELYAKVLRTLDEPGNRCLIHFTSVPPAVRTRLNRLAGHEQVSQ